MAAKKEFKRQYIADVLQWRSEGMTLNVCCGKWMVSANILTRWRKEHPEFNEAIELSAYLAEEWWLKQGLKILTGENPKGNATVWIFAMKNIAGWRDKVETSSATDRDIAKLSDTERLARIAQLINSARPGMVGGDGGESAVDGATGSTDGRTLQ